MVLKYQPHYMNQSQCGDGAWWVRSLIQTHIIIISMKSISITIMLIMRMVMDGRGENIRQPPAVPRPVTLDLPGQLAT